MLKEHVTLKRITAITLIVTLLLTTLCVFPVGAEKADTVKGKTLLFAGDSIGAGWRDTDGVDDFANSGGWAKRLADDYGMEVTAAATAGAPLSSIREAERRPAIVNQLHTYKNSDFDYVILQGGFNDAMGTDAERTKETAAKLGEMTDNYSQSGFDTATFAGALENLFYYAKEYFSEAKVGFIITYATPLSTYGGYTAEADSMREYWNMAKAICDKWGVSYLDLFDGNTEDGSSYSYDILKVDTEANFPGGTDQIHLTASGYDLTTPYIASWLPTTTPILCGSSVVWEKAVPEDAVVYLDFETEYSYASAHAYTNDTVYYCADHAENWNGSGAANARGNNSSLITEPNGNTAVEFTWDDGNNENYRANGLMNIYDPETSSTFIGEKGRWYNISFKVKVQKSDNIPIQFYLATCGRTYENETTAFKTTDCNFNHINAMKTATWDDLRVYAAGETFTAPTSGWVTVSANWYADGTHFPIIGVTANNKTTIADLTEYASVLVDDVTVTEATDFVVDFESNLSSYYSGNTNWTAGKNGRDSENELAALSDGNNAVRLTWAKDNGNNYNDACALNIYDPLTALKFVGESGKTYKISFDYLIENTDGIGLQFYISKCGRRDLGDTDMGPKAMQATYIGSTIEPSYVSISDKLTSSTTEWATITTTFTADGTISAQNTTVTNYPVLILQANDKTKVEGAPTTGTYASVLVDNIRVEEVKNTGSATGFEVKLNETDHSVFYNAGDANNWTSASGRGNNASWTTDGGNSVIRFTWDSDNSNENYGANNAMKILDPTTGTRFMGEEGEKYVISFKYKVENTDNKNLQFYLAPCNRVSQKNPSWAPSDLGGTDLGPKATIPNSTTTFIPAGTVNTDGEWHTAYAEWTGASQINRCDVYPLLLLEANGKTADTSKTSGFASVLIDDITVAYDTKGTITAYNYDGENAVTLDIAKSTTFADLENPERKGWIFDGFYLNAALTVKATSDMLVGEAKAIYVKWTGDGTAMTPTSIKDYISFSAKAANFTTITSNWNSNPMYDVEAIGLTCARDTATVQVGAANVSGWNGEYVFSADKVVLNDTQAVVADNLTLATPAASVMFYVELADFEKAGKDYGISLGNRGFCLYVANGSSYGYDWFKPNSDGTSEFYYTDEGEWKTSTVSSDGVFTGLPTAYKGYIRLDMEQFSGATNLETASYKFNCLEIEPSVVGGECGDFVLGGIVYAPASRTNSTVCQIKNTVNSTSGTYNYFYYDIAASSSAMSVIPSAAYSADGSFGTRYSGTTGTPAVIFTDVETSAFWGDAPVGITTLSGEKETTSGYMTTYINPTADITLQPGVDSFMVYVEMPEFEKSSINAPLKLLDLTLTQSGTIKTLMFSNSAYSYADVHDGIWHSARAGADGDLKDIPSGFTGFIRFCIKDFKGINDISYYDANGNLSGIDLAKPYTVSRIELGFNHIGGENGELIIGAFYSVMQNSDTVFIKHGTEHEKFCYKVIAGDYDASGDINATELTMLRKQLLGIEMTYDPIAELRANIEIDIRDLVRAKKSIAFGTIDLSNDADCEISPNIFSNDIGTTSGAVVYSRVKTDPVNYQVITQDYDAYKKKGDAFAAELLANQIGTFEKTGIDKMCHVSTFYYSHGNIYASYYANTVSAAENPAYQVARLAYAPEDNSENKIIIDIMQVGDELYGQKITGVYDTIIMPKEDEPDNLYILWTAAVNGEYYRLYQVFNMATEELGPIGVNRFKVGNTTNDFSRAGMMKALNKEGHGYKTFASDIGIMQKLSTRLENGETYYYTGAYCCDFTCIIKSKDLITWEYVAQPNEGANGTGFDNCTRWENAVYVVGDKVYYYVRQWDPLGVTSNGGTTTSTTNRCEQGSYYGILTAYDLITGEWEKPILVEDCQSRSDFIMYKGNLYLIYAPTPDAGESDRFHLGILKINTKDLSKTEVVLQAKIGTSCFYPFWQYNSGGELCISYTYLRKEIRLASINLSKYLDS